MFWFYIVVAVVLSSFVKTFRVPLRTPDAEKLCLASQFSVPGPFMSDFFKNEMRLYRFAIISPAQSMHPFTYPVFLVPSFGSMYFPMASNQCDLSQFTVGLFLALQFAYLLLSPKQMPAHFPGPKN